ncbi:MAG: HYR domain-containing protein, partial [Chloroflexota bacterium]|nr:HYR domain-containing protein [Chloroflexota bacterium]
CVPASGSTFPLGATTVTCSATDAAGNTGQATFTVTVVDTTPPVVTVPADITTEAASAAGTAVAFSTSATDTVDGSVAVTCAPASGSTFPLGVTTVTCEATDAAGNTGQATFTVTVIDTTPPTITTPEGTTPPDLTVRATGPTGAVVSFSLVATDGIDGSLTPTCTPASGSLFPVGTTTVTCSVVDRAGNTGQVSFEVTVTPYEGVTPTTPPTSTEAGVPAGPAKDSIAIVFALAALATIGMLAVAIATERRRLRR